MSKKYQARLLDSFNILNVEKGKTVIDTYKKLRNSIVFVLEGQVEILFPKFINSKASQKILSSMKEVKNIQRDTSDRKQLFGV